LGKDCQLRLLTEPEKRKLEFDILFISVRKFKVPFSLIIDLLKRIQIEVCKLGTCV